MQMSAEKSRAKQTMAPSIVLHWNKCHSSSNGGFRVIVDWKLADNLRLCLEPARNLT